jgi:hypothetical protein
MASHGGLARVNLTQFQISGTLVPPLVAWLSLCFRFLMSPFVRIGLVMSALVMYIVPLPWWAHRADQMQPPTS